MNLLVADGNAIPYQFAGFLESRNRGFVPPREGAKVIATKQDLLCG